MTALIFMCSFSIPKKPTQMKDVMVHYFFHTGVSGQAFTSTFIATNRDYHMAKDANAALPSCSATLSSSASCMPAGFLNIICDISLNFIFCSEALICSALSSGFLQPHLIYTASPVMSVLAESAGVFLRAMYI